MPRQKMPVRMIFTNASLDFRLLELACLIPNRPPHRERLCFALPEDALECGRRDSGPACHTPKSIAISNYSEVAALTIPDQAVIAGRHGPGHRRAHPGHGFRRACRHGRRRRIRGPWDAFGGGRRRVRLHCESRPDKAKGTMHPLKVGDRYLLDVYCPSDGVRLPVHLFFKLRLEKGSAWLAEMQIDRIVLTASPSELRRYLLPYVADCRSFDGENELRRIKQVKGGNTS